MASVLSSWFSLNANEVATLLHVSLPFAIGFLASLLFYRWVNRTGMQSAGFSPTVASILSTPIIAVSYFSFIYSFVAYRFLATNFRVIGSEMLVGLMRMVFFLPILLILPPLLVFYLRGAFRRRRTISKVLLCTATVASLILQGLWLRYFLEGS